MSFQQDEGCFEVRYATKPDMAPDAQALLLRAIERTLKYQPVTLLFVVDTLDVPKEVPLFWLDVTKRLAPNLCAFGIVSDSLAVRVAASGFSVTSRMRQVKIDVKAFTPEQLTEARAWCSDRRAERRKLSAAAADGSSSRSTG